MSRSRLHRRTRLCTLILQAQNINSRTTSHIRSHTLALQHNTSTTLSVQAHEHKTTGSHLRMRHLARLKTNNMFSHCPPSEFSSEILESRARPGPTMLLHSRACVTQNIQLPSISNPGVEPPHCLLCSINCQKCNLRWTVHIVCNKNGPDALVS